MGTMTRGGIIFLEKKYAEYAAMVKAHTPGSDKAAGFARAFWVGGLICALGQGVTMAAQGWLGLDPVASGSFTSVLMVFLGVLLTGIGVYDDIGRYAGAGSVVPITGFANSVASPAIEFRREGLVMGVGARLFTVAGPVLVYGIAASAAAGAVYYFVCGG